MSFKLFFKCEDCEEVMANTKIKIGQNYLTINFMHYLIQLANSFNKNQEGSQRKTKF